MKYSQIVFMQIGSDGDETYEIFEKYGELATMKYLMQWDNGEDNDIRNESSAGTADRQYKHGCYIMSYNLRMGYFGLEKIIEED